MDVIRSCYTTRMGLWRDDPTRTVRVRWFWADPGAEVFTGLSPFRSRDFDASEDPRALGEVKRHGRWDNGRWGGLLLGKGNCGDDTLLLTGATASDSPVSRDTDGVPTCCVRPTNTPFLGGGVAGGGTGAVVLYMGGGGEGSGSATLEVVHGIESAGGLLAGGAAVPQVLAAGSGGVLVGGWAQIAGTSPAVSAGGVLGGGSAVLARGEGRTSAGGVLAGGSAVLTNTTPALSAGGVLGGGSAVLAHGEGRRSAGGVLAGGTFRGLDTTPALSSGGVLGGGVGAMADTTPALSSGGVLGGGVGAMADTTPALSSGGVLGGGSGARRDKTPAGSLGGLLAGGKSTATLGTSGGTLHTPAGGCGSLPTTMVVRWSSCTGSLQPINGQAVTITWQSGSSSWSGSVTINSIVWQNTLTCSGGTWSLMLYFGMGSASAPASGTSGSAPNLVAHLSTTSPQAGAGTATITAT